MKNIILKLNDFFAHTKENEVELLKEHIFLTEKYLERLAKNKGLYKIFLYIFAQITANKETQNTLIEMTKSIFTMHDIGKINTNYQYLSLGNKNFKNNIKESNYRNHSMLSALLYINHHLNSVRQAPPLERDFLLIFLVLNSYIISKHHGSLDSIADYAQKLCNPDGEGRRVYEQEKELFENNYNEPFILNYNLMSSLISSFKNAYNNISEEIQINLFIYSRLIMSTLLACDYYATTEFMTGKEIELPDSIRALETLQSQYKNTEINRSIRKYEYKKYPQDISSETNINVLRTEMFLDAEKAFTNNPNASIYYLEAPTGGGKSNIAFNLAFKLARQWGLSKIINVYPFNTLVEQNIETIGKTFEEKDIKKYLSVINSITPTKERAEGDSNSIDYERSLLDRQFLHDPLILTTHVSLFDYLFGTSKSSLFPLYQLTNSVIILDEVQAYKNMIWKEIIVMLKKYAELLNIKFIIMSATLPNLDKLAREETGTVRLLTDRDKYYNHPLFKDRVKIDYSLLNIKKESLILKPGGGILFEHVINQARNKNKKIMIEFIKKKTAKSFWEFLIKYKKDLGLKDVSIELITGDDNSVERKRIIESIKNENNRTVILVATQVIEAGVDLDMDIGYKDISLLDSEEQFMGRINRSCLRDGTVFFFNYDNISSIYRNDFRKMDTLTLLNKDIQKILISKDFESFYEKVLNKIKEKSVEDNEWSYKSFIEKKIKNLDFIKIKEHMTLIDTREELRVFLNYEINKEDGSKIVGKDIWDEFVSILKNKEFSYAERKVKISKVLAKMEPFIYSLPLTADLDYNDVIGDIYYVEEGYKYFTENKFMGRNVMDSNSFV